MFKIKVYFFSLARMEDDLKLRMNQDLQNKLDRLCLMKLQPALYLSHKFDDIISKIDYDAELLMNELGSREKPVKNEPTTLQVNEARCELIRILKIVAENLRAQLLENESKEIDQDFVALQEKIELFQGTPFSSGDDINDLEDSYVQLLLEVTKMSDFQESRIFGGQTIFYLSSNGENKFGCLFHLADVYFTKEQIEYLR